MRIIHIPPVWTTLGATSNRPRVAHLHRANTLAGKIDDCLRAEEIPEVVSDDGVETP
jgi:hypothetical protein